MGAVCLEAGRQIGPMYLSGSHFQAEECVQQQHGARSGPRVTANVAIYIAQ